MNIIFTIFCLQNLAKYSPKRTKLHHLKKKNRESMLPNHPNKHVS